MSQRIALGIASVGLVCAGLAACAGSPDYDFRDAERPDFDRTVTVDELAAARNRDRWIVLDVRLTEDRAANPVLIPGAEYKNPELISEWSGSLPGDATVVVYCVKGKWVSQKAANYLDAQGVDVYSLEGGIDAWERDARQH